MSETINNEANKQKREFLGMLLSILGASLLGNDATRIDGVMTTFNLIEYSDAYSKISENFMAIL